MAGPSQGHTPVPEAGIKPLPTPAGLTSLHLPSSTRELSWACPPLGFSLSWPLFRKHIFPPH